MSHNINFTDTISVSFKFVFPIYSLGHYYIICYNMKKRRLEIIDNRVQTDSVEETYGDLPARLVCVILINF